MSRKLAGCVMFLLLATLAGDSLAAAQPVRRSPQVSASGFARWLAGFLQKAGCTIDPDGGTCQGLSAPPHDNGCTIDPNGCAKGQPKRDEGCTIDPDGCAPAVSNTDNGCTIDPSGRCLK